jgi:DNA-binding transcriptional MocR family regulator
MTGERQKIINLQQGCPTPCLVPTQAIAEASQSVLAQPDIAQRLMYGPDGGEDYVRANISRWLTTFYHPKAGPITPNRIAITNGASNALSTILQVCTDPSYTRAVWIVEPTYFLARKIWLDAGFGDKMCPLPDHGDGIDLAFWRQRLEETDHEHASQPTSTSKNESTGFPKIYKHVLYLVPTNSNPIGHTSSYDTRVKIVELAREFDVLVIADDVYDFLRWPKEENSLPHALEAPPARLVDIDRSLEGGSPFGNAISNGSFSKIVAPGMRVGWVEGDPAFILLVESV